MIYLPKHNLWDSVTLIPADATPPEKKPWLIFCKHLRRVSYQRTDHRTGPGWMSDNYEGEACLDCAKIITETKTY